jgi:hypothetical protein
MITNFAATEPHISLAAEEIFKLGPVSITNSIILGVIGIVATVCPALLCNFENSSAVSVTLWTGVVQWAFEGFYDQAVDIIGDKQTARRIFPARDYNVFLLSSSPIG